MKWYIVGLVMGFLLGVTFIIVMNELVNMSIENIENEHERTIDGTYITNITKKNLKENLERKDKKGDWVCVNVRQMSFSRAYEVCVHECSHKTFSEIFSERCENNPEQCIEQMEDFLK